VREKFWLEELLLRADMKTFLGEHREPKSCSGGAGSFWKGIGMMVIVLMLKEGPK
jgi:hypothetical protein